MENEILNKMLRLCKKDGSTEGKKLYSILGKINKEAEKGKIKNKN